MTKQEVIDRILSLPREEQVEIAHLLIDEVVKPKATQKRDRTPSLHAGKIWVSDDFDDPLVIT